MRCGCVKHLTVNKSSAFPAFKTFFSVRAGPADGIFWMYPGDAVGNSKSQALKFGMAFSSTRAALMGMSTKVKQLVRAIRSFSENRKKGIAP